MTDYTPENWRVGIRDDGLLGWREITVFSDDNIIASIADWPTKEQANETAELIASAPRLKCERDELAECVNELYDALVNLESAARGMPNSHDDLCQGTLNLACEEARNIIAKVEK